jgi:hypothetical protein
MRMRFIREQLHHPLLGFAFDLAGGAHTSLVFPVSNACTVILAMRIFW